MENHHELLGGKLQVYRRGNSHFWQCSASVGGKQWRTTTKQANIALAQKVAQDWYLGLCGKDAAGTLTTEKTVQDAAEKFTKEYEVITVGERSPKWVQCHQDRLRLHLLPFFGKMARGAAESRNTILAANISMWRIGIRGISRKARTWRYSICRKRPA